MKRKILSLILCLHAAVYALPEAKNDLAVAPESTPAWVSYLGDKMDVTTFYPFELVIFNPFHHPILAPLLVKNKTLLASVSLGDVKNNDPLFKEFSKLKLIAAPHPYHKENSVIDIRNPKWEEKLLNSILPSVLAEGFNGFCLCNLDAAINLEMRQPNQYQGMTEAAIRLLAAIKDRYKGYTIMVDVHGLLHFADRLLPYTDLFYYENLLTKRNAKMTLASAQNYLLAVKRLQDLQEKKPALKVYTLDLWNAKDVGTIRNIYLQQRLNGFYPSVTENLLMILPEPGSAA